MTQDCKYRGKKVLATDFEEAYHCDGIQARELGGKPCDRNECRYDPLANLCRVPRVPARSNGGVFGRLGEGRFV